MQLMTAQAEKEKAVADAEAEKARALQAEYSAKAANHEIGRQEELAGCLRHGQPVIHSLFPVFPVALLPFPQLALAFSFSLPFPFSFLFFPFPFLFFVIL
jgi:hypothetical protein